MDVKLWVASRVPLPVAMLFIAASCVASPTPSVSPAKPSAAAKSPFRHEFTHPALGTRFHIVVYCPDRSAAGRAEAAVFRRLGELEEVFDDTRPSSELAQVYANAGIGAVHASDDLFRLLRQSQKLSQRSEGAFEVTAGASAKLWGRAADAATLPTADELAEAGALAGGDKLRLDAISRTVRVTTAGVRLDLSDVVRAYACDAVLGALRSGGFPSALVDGGRRVAVGAPPPGRDAWLIEVTNAPPTSGRRIVRLKHQSIASSARAGEVVDIGGVTYSRLLDPRTGLGAQNVVPVTVVARRAWQADTLARAAAVLGETDTRPLIRAAPDAKAWFHRPPGEMHTMEGQRAESIASEEELPATRASAERRVPPTRPGRAPE